MGRLTAMRRLIDFFFGCRHRRTTFPQTRKGLCYTACLDCGAEVPYDAEWLVPR